MTPTVRCSGLDQLLLCHGSRTLIDRVGVRSGSESFEGTFIHWDTAACLVKYLGATPSAGGLQEPQVPTGYRLSKHSEWLAPWFLAQVKETVPNDWSLEVELPLAYAFPNFILSGHLDLLAGSPDGKKFKGKDWKTGYKAVDPAEMNNQVLGYIGLIKRAYPAAEEIEFEVCQPRAREDEGEQRVSTVTLCGPQLDKALAYLERKIDEALADPTALETGIAQCAWCPAAMQCPAIHKLIDEMKAKLTPEIVASIKTSPDDPLLAEIVLAAKTLDRIFEDAKDLLKGRLSNGFQIVSKDGVRITQVIQGGRWGVEDPIGMFEAVTSNLPKESVANIVDYSTSKLRDEIATLKGCPKTGKADVTAEKVFLSTYSRYLKQGVRHVLKFE